MKFVIITSLIALAAAAPDHGRPRYDSISYESYESYESGEIITDEFDIQDDGTYRQETETSNGIKVSQSGDPSGPEGSVRKAGSFSWTAPDGTPVRVNFVADEHGYQPESDLLPVAPEFPHPIPDFVLEQIAKAAAEDRGTSREVPSGSRYGSRYD